MTHRLIHMLILLLCLRGRGAEAVAYQVGDQVCSASDPTCRQVDATLPEVGIPSESLKQAVAQSLLQKETQINKKSHGAAPTDTAALSMARQKALEKVATQHNKTLFELRDNNGDVCEFDFTTLPTCTYAGNQPTHMCMVEKAGVVCLEAGVWGDLSDCSETAAEYCENEVKNHCGGTDCISGGTAKQGRKRCIKALICKKMSGCCGSNTGLWTHYECENAGTQAWMSHIGNAHAPYANSDCEQLPGSYNGGVIAAVAPWFLESGQNLNEGKYLLSRDGVYRLRMQPDGNLVLTKGNNQVLWGSGTSGKRSSPYMLRLQPDGNLVLKAGNPQQVIWKTSTAGAGSLQLFLQKDGNLVLRNQDHSAIWASNTAHSMLQQDSSSNESAMADADEVAQVDDSFLREAKIEAKTQADVDGALERKSNQC